MFVKTPSIAKYLYPSLVWKKNTEQKKIWITFDDGPDEKVTPFLVSLLGKYNIKATFFIIGSLTIYSIKDFGNKEVNSYELTSKEFGFLLNNLLLVVLAISILFGTIFPLIYEAFTNGKQISVGAPYFEIILFPFAETSVPPTL